MSRAFVDVVRQLDGGACYENLTAQLAEIVQGVIATRKMGELSLKLSVKPNGENSVSITESVKLKVPEPPRAQTIFFTTVDGDLLRDDPRQAKLPLRSVDEPARELREVSVG